jgi:hypothetical protein
MPSFHVPRWLRTHTTLLLWAMFASVTSPMLMLVFSYYQTLHRAEASLQAAVEQATRRIDSLLTTTDLILMDLAADIQNLDALNTETALNLAQTITYADPRFREVGIVDEDGALVVTSLGILDPRFRCQMTFALTSIARPCKLSGQSPPRSCKSDRLF